jgi:hypothetical protein
VGGHGMYVCGFIDINGRNNNDLEIIENTLSKNFAKLQNYNSPEWKPLLKI